MTNWNLTTLGYNARQAGKSLEALMGDERVLLIDTRMKPWSQRPEWRQAALKSQWGKRYRYAGDYLGNINYKSDGEIVIADFATGLRGIAQYLNEGYRLILLCGCREYASCHRKVIAERVLACLPGVRFWDGQE